MSREQTNDAMNRLLALLYRSFPQYLVYAPPFVSNGDQRALLALQQIVADQRLLGERIVNFLLNNEGRVELGEFPMEFTDTHDLSVAFIIRLAISYQQQDIAAIEQIVDTVRLSPAAANLAEETLGLAKGHLENLLELQTGEKMTNEK